MGIQGLLRKLSGAKNHFRLFGTGLRFNAFEEYVAGVPTDQNILDIFSGEWSCSMPSARSDLTAGSVGTFEDARIEWAAEQLGGFQGKRVLELGPLEAGHTYMLERMGAEFTTSIEASRRAFLKCLAVKELFDLKRSKFLLGDCAAYLAATDHVYDVCVACGILYHMKEPVSLLQSISRHCRQVFIWTHYFDSEIASGRKLRKYFGEAVKSELNGFPFTLHKHFYLSSFRSPRFRGGMQNYSYWMEREEILGALRHFGFEDIRTGLEDRTHPAGPAFCITAVRA